MQASLGTPLSKIKLATHPRSFEKQAKPKARNPTLDIFRGVAVLLVMFNHIYIIDPVAVTNPVIKGLRQVIGYLFTGGWIGVDLFFVLSGFLISGLLFKEYEKTADFQPTRFLIRRGFKLYPSFICFLIITFCFEVFYYSRASPDFPRFQDYLKDLIFMNNYAGGRWSHTWSLAVEEHFYILLSVYFLVSVRYKVITFKTFAYTYVALMVVALTSRVYLNVQYPTYDFDLHYTLTHARISALFYGVFISYCYHFRREQLVGFLQRWKVWLLVLACSFLATNFIFAREENSWISMISLSVNPLCFSVLLLVALNFTGSFFKEGILSYIGQQSYNIYLWHVFMNSIIYHLFINHLANQYMWLLYMASFFVASFLAGIFFTKVVEIPLLKVREKIAALR
ncbi:acyltransferase family protein [Hymenobacter sp. B1770]|uniref:acyltransferase family protein n=1 Tax=Hymenobacter sp. B1770 TaxID=1718788 RepID=UPI003CEBDA63